LHEAARPGAYEELPGALRSVWGGASDATTGAAPLQAQAAAAAAAAAAPSPLVLAAVRGNADAVHLLLLFGEARRRGAHEAALLAAIDGSAPEYVVLARYMRVLSAAAIARYPDRIVNIHHSFLPAFAGASPYRQAFARGVKLIGATAHFVTEELDAGPIIAQDVTAVDHTDTPERMAQAGRDVEKLVLARAVRLVLEERVFLHGGRTVVFA
jgi:formyltetrahydrofolate deformylase